MGRVLSMKKSEMISRLKDALRGYYVEYDAVVLMLETAEKLGMQPPYSPKAFQKLAKIYIEPNANVWDDEQD